VIAFYYPGSQNGYYIQKAFVVSIPEPSTYMLFGIGSLALVIAYRRRKGCVATAGSAKVA